MKRWQKKVRWIVDHKLQVNERLMEVPCLLFDTRSLVTPLDDLQLHITKNSLAIITRIYLTNKGDILFTFYRGAY